MSDPQISEGLIYHTDNSEGNISHFLDIRFLLLMLQSERSDLYIVLISECQILAINPLDTELNPIRHLLALIGARHIVHVSRVRVKATNAT